MKSHPPYHWIAVTLALAVSLLTLSELHGQSLPTPASPASASDVSARSDVKPARDQSVAKDQRSAAQKGKRAVKRTISRARHGNAPIDSQSDSKGTAGTR